MRQVTYVRIRDDLHPEARAEDIGAFIESDPQVEDYLIVDEIIKYNQSLGLRDVGGEWSWLNQVKRKVYIEALEKNDREVLAKLFSNFFQNNCGYGIITPAYSEISKLDLASQIRLDIDALIEFSNDPFKQDDLVAPKIGSPFGLQIEGGGVVLPDSPRHLYFAQKLQRYKCNILEIGGGYGGLIYFLKKNGFQGTYFNVDLPETLYISYYYLRKNKIKCKLLIDQTCENEKDTVYLVPNFLLDKISENIHFEVFFNANSLSEMDVKYVNEYFNIINNKRPKNILHSNSNFLVFPDSERHIEVLARDFPIDHNLYSKVYQLISPFQGASGRYREYLYQLN